MGEKGVKVDHATINCWVVDYSPFIAAEAKNANITLPSDKCGLALYEYLRQKNFFDEDINPNHLIMGLNNYGRSLIAFSVPLYPNLLCHPVFFHIAIKI
jgi:hypothetical protein